MEKSLTSLVTTSIIENQNQFTYSAWNCSAIKALPIFKASGVDDIPAEFYKTNAALVAEILPPLIASCWDKEELFKDWNKGIKGDSSNCNNWTGIRVILSIHKLVAQVILERLKEHLYCCNSGWSGYICAD